MRRLRLPAVRFRRAVSTVGILALLTTALVALPVVAAAQDGSADGPDCLPAGGVDRPFAAPQDFDASGFDILVHGGGWGHGVGMSQYGALGAARAGCTYSTILSTYYPGTELRSATSPDVVRVGLDKTLLTRIPYRNTLRSAGGDDVPWELCEGGACIEVETQRADSAADQEWTVVVLDPEADGAAWALARDGEEVWRGGTSSSTLRAHNDGSVVRLPTTAGAWGGSYLCADRPGFCVKWGFTEFSRAGSTVYIVQHVTAGTGPDGAQHSAVDRYLWGLSEVPVSWDLAAQQAQAVAGRTYALRTIENRRSTGTDVNSTCQCDLLPTVSNQHWTGWERERVDTGGRWRQAVATTANEALYGDNGGDTLSLAATVYSSSHGGWSESVEHVWGTPYPYLKAVDTSRWECLSGNSRQRWTVGFTRAQLASRFGLAELDDVRVAYRGPGGRPTVLDVDGDGKEPDGVVVTGRDGSGTQVTKRYGTEAIRRVLGTWSGLVHFDHVEDGVDRRPAQEPTCEAAPAADRVSGTSRITTATAASAYGWDTSPTVVIARADHPADALAGSGLAGDLDAPMLITWSDRLEPAVAEEVNRLGATTAVLMGGEAALSADVAEALLDDTTVETVERAEGPTRIHTAVAVADRLTIPPDGSALLVRGSNAQHPEREWPDALSVAAIAAHQARAKQAWPILLTGAELPEVTLDALERYGTKKVYAVGGDAVIPDAMVQQLRDRGYEVERLAGPDRWATSRAALGVPVGDAQVLVAATGFNFPDGLAAGALAARLGGRVLLVTRTHTPGQTPWQADQHPAAVSALGWEDGKVVIVGGEGVVEDAVGRALRNAM